MNSNFKVPNEYKDFVSSADDLFNQIYGGENDSSDSADDVIHFSIFFDDEPKSGNAMLAKAMERRRELEDILLLEMKNLLWQCEVQHLAIIFASKEQQLYFTGSCRNMATIDDEWTLVYILLNLSKKINTISISVTDNDGQFLLIEAADHLPDWLGPESAGNRVWLRCGQVIIVPYDEPGRQRDGGIELSAALQYLRKKAAVPSQDSGPDSSWMKKMNKHIRSRTIDVFPAKAIIQEHVVACILPKIISELLQKSPELISVAVSAFCSYNNNARLQQSRKRASCSSSSQSDKSPRQPTLPLLLDSSLSDAASLTVAPVRFTRALYAKLVFQKFHPPRKFHSLMRLVSSSGSKKVISAFELGCKLCVGLEQAALHELTVCIPATEAVQATDEHWKRFLLSARSYGFNLSDEGTMKRLSDLFQGKSIIISSSCEGFDSFAAFSALFESTYGRAKEILDGIQISPLISSRETIAAAAAAVVVVSSFDDEEQSNFLRNQIFAPVLKKTVRNDSDAWLYMTPEELDVEMNKRMQAEAGVAARPSEVVVSEEEGDANSKGKEAEAGAISGDDEAKQMQDIIDGIKTFMAGKSDYDGVQVNNKNKNNKTTTTKKEKKKHNITASTTAMGSSSNIAEDISDFGNLDFDYISNMLQNTGNNAQGDTLNDDEDDGDDDDEEDEEGDDDSDGDDSDDYSEAESDPVQNSSSEIRAAASSGLGRFTIPRGRLGEDNLAAEDSEAEEQSNELDSDDEAAEDNDGGRFRGTGEANKGRSRPPITIADYQGLMDEELQADSNLLDLFESLAPDGGNPNSDADMSYHLLKNILESQANTIGYPGGPIHHLLAQMGIQIPKPPPSNTRK